MPAAGTKCTFKFNARGDKGYGWSEQYFLVGATPDNFDTEIAKAEALATIRLSLLAHNCSLLEITCSDLATPRRYKVVSYSENFEAGGAVGTEAMPGNALLLIKENETGTAHGHTFLKGVRADEWNAQGDYTPGPAFGPNMASFKAKLISDRWGFLGESTALALRQANVSNVADGADGRPVITTAAAIAGLTVGKKYKISVAGVQGAAAVNGQHIATLTGASEFTLIRRTPIFPYVTGGIVTVYLQEVVVMTSVIVDGWVQRKDGRPFGLLHGRAKVRNLG